MGELAQLVQGAVVRLGAGRGRAALTSFSIAVAGGTGARQP